MHILLEWLTFRLGPAWDSGGLYDTKYITKGKLSLLATCTTSALQPLCCRMDEYVMATCTNSAP